MINMPTLLRGCPCQTAPKWESRCKQRALQRHLFGMAKALLKSAIGALLEPASDKCVLSVPSLDLFIPSERRYFHCHGRADLPGDDPVRVG